MGSVTSYARARAEALGMQAKGGIAERADRLVAILGDDRPRRHLLDAAGPDPGHARRRSRVASTVTVVQRILLVRSQAKDQARA